MAEPLEIDLDFRANDAEALAALGRFEDSAAQITADLTAAFQAGSSLADQIGSVDTSGLETAAQALGQLGDTDLSGLTAAAGQLDEAAPAVDQIATSLAAAADSSDQLAAASDVDPAGAEQLALSLSDASDAAAGVGAGLQPDLFDQAAASAQGIETALADVSDQVAKLEDLGELLALFDEAATSAAELGGALDQASQSAVQLTDALANAGKQSGENVNKERSDNAERERAVGIAAALGAEFEKVQVRVSSLGAPMARFTDSAVKAVGSLEGAAGLTVSGFAAGAAGLLLAGESYKKASDTIALSTGATGSALDDLRDTFDKTLESSGRNAQELAQILGTLARDTNLSGDALASATAGVAKFFKATNGGVGDVRSLTQALRALGGDADDLKGFEDDLAQTTSHFGIGLSSLLQQIKVAGPILATFGFDRGQVTGLIGELDQAGLSIQRLVPGLTKLANAARNQGKSAAESLTDLIAKIKGAASSTEALSEVQGVFSGRVAAGFVQAVRNGTVDLGKLNAVMDQAPGSVSRLAESVKGLGGQFGAIRNDITGTFGRAGLPLIEGLRTGIESIRPFLHELFQIIGELNPAFKGFAEAAFLPVEALKLLEPVLHLIDTVLSHIPGPVLEAVGAFAAFKLIPFAAIANGIGNLAIALPRLVFAGTGAAAGVQGLGAALAAINPYTLAATAALVVLFSVIEQRNREAEESKRRVEALNKAVGDLGTTADVAGPKVEELLKQGSKGNIISDAQLANVAKLGASTKLLLDTAAAFASGNRSQVTDLTTQLVKLQEQTIENGKAFEQTSEDRGVFGNIVDAVAFLGGPGAAAFVHFGVQFGHVNDAADGTKKAIDDLIDTINDQAKAQLDQLTVQGKITAQDRVDAAVKAGLKDETAGEAKVRDILVSKLNSERAEKAGLAVADQAETERRGTILDGLEKEGALRDQVSAKSANQATIINTLAEASRSGIASDEDRIKLIEKLVDGGADQEEAVKQVAEAEQQLQQIQSKYATNTQGLNTALTTTFRLLGQGASTFDALAGAASSSGVDINTVEAAFSGLQSSVEKLAPPAEASAEAMAALITATGQGLDPQQTMAALLEATGGNAAGASLAIDEYAQGLSDTSKALDLLNPKLGTVIGKLQEGAADLIFGADAAGQLAAADELRQARLTALDREKADLEAQKEARSQAADEDIRLQKEALGKQKDIIEEAAKARGEAADTSAIDAQIARLKAETNTDDLDQRIAEIELRQKDVDAALERSRAALKVFGDEEQAIRAAASLRASDIDSQVAQLEASRQLAVDQAAARGELFNTGPLDAQIAALREQRNRISAGLDQDIADAQAKSGQVQQAVTDAAGGLLNFGTVLDTFEAQLSTKLARAQAVADLRAQGLGDTVALLFSDDLGLSDADKAAFLNQIATMSPEERTALERHSEEVQNQLKVTNAATEKAGDIFAKPNPEFVNSATARGKDMAKGLADGIVQGMSDERINEIIDIAIRSGADPAAVRDFFRQRGVDAATGIKDGIKSSGFDAVGVSTDLISGVEQQMGLAGSTSGAAYVAEAQEAIRTTPIDIDAAAAMLAPVKDQLPIEGLAGGQSVASAANDAIRNSPIDADAASVLVANLQAQMPVEGVNAGAGYAQGVPAGMVLYPVPTETGTILVSSVSQALSVAGTDAGANYALSVASGIAAAQGDAIAAAHLMAIRVDEAGHVGLEAASPSKKGIRLGGFYAEGLAQGLREGVPLVAAAATQVANAVSVPLPQPALVGAGSAVGHTTGGGFTSQGTVEGAAGTSVVIENVNVTGTTSATADEVAAAVSRKIGWLGITGRHEL